MFPYEIIIFIGFIMLLCLWIVLFIYEYWDFF